MPLSEIKFDRRDNCCKLTERGSGLFFRPPAFLSHRCNRKSVTVTQLAPTPLTAFSVMVWAPMVTSVSAPRSVMLTLVAKVPVVLMEASCLHQDLCRPYRMKSPVRRVCEPVNRSSNSMVAVLALVLPWMIVSVPSNRYRS